MDSNVGGGGGGKARSLHEILAAKRANAAIASGTSTSVDGFAPSSLTSSVEFSTPKLNVSDSLSPSFDDIPIRPLGGSNRSERSATARARDTPIIDFDNMPIRAAGSVNGDGSSVMSSGSVGLKSQSHKDSTDVSCDDHLPANLLTIESTPVVLSEAIDDRLMMQQTQNAFQNYKDNDEEEEEEEEEEAEMPSSSFTVLGDNTDLLQLLAGASISPSYSNAHGNNGNNIPATSSFYNTIPNTSSFVTPSNPPPPNTSSALSESSLNEDMIELYSTISMLKKENNDLLKEIEFVKKSKDAIIHENSIKSEQHIQRLKLELHEQQQYNSSLNREKEDLVKEFELMKVDMEFLIKQKEEMEQTVLQLRQHQNKYDDSSSSSSSSLKSDLLTMKTELNKLRMENSRYKSDNDNMTYDNQQLKNELKELQHHLEEENHRQETMIKDLQGNVRKLEEINLTIKTELNEKNTQIGRMMSDWMSLERNFKNAVMDNDNLKQRIATLESSERELNQARYHISTLENDYRNLQNEVSNLRSQVQQQQHQLQQQQMTQQHQSGGVRSSTYSSMMQSTPSVSSYVSSTPQRVPPAPPSYSHDNFSSQSNFTANSTRIPPANYNSNRYDDDYSGRPSYGSYGDGPTASSMGNVIGGSTGSGKACSKSLSSALGDVSDLRRNIPPPNTPVQETRSSNQGSLANLLQGRKGAVEEPTSMSITGEGRGRKPLGQAIGGSGVTPFATEKTHEMMISFDSMERDLTRYMTEKTSLMEESEKLQVRGMKTLADRTRMQKVEARLDELNKEISGLRRKLSGKPA